MCGAIKALIDRDEMFQIDFLSKTQSCWTPEEENVALFIMFIASWKIPKTIFSRSPETEKTPWSLRSRSLKSKLKAERKVICCAAIVPSSEFIL